MPWWYVWIGGIAPHTLSLGIIWPASHSRPFTYIKQLSSTHSETGRAPGEVWMEWREEKPVPLPGIEPGSSSP
jgi:hypothetical protein